MSKTLCLLAALAALASAGAPAHSASHHQAAASDAPIAAMAGGIRLASEIVSADFGLPGTAAPNAGNGEQHLAKTGLWSSVKSAAKKVGGAVKKAAKAVGRAAVKYVPKFPPVNGVIQGYKAARYFAKKKFG